MARVPPGPLQRGPCHMMRLPLSESLISRLTAKEWLNPLSLLWSEMTIAEAGWIWETCPDPNPPTTPRPHDSIP